MERRRIDGAKQLLGVQLSAQSWQNGALSAHATGCAIDINPLQNPYISGEIILPPNAVYDAKIPGTLIENGPVVRAFESRGWVWGGRWTSLKDWHHFEKPSQ